MRILTLEELLEAGCHFGHQVTRQNPKARDFVFEARDNIHIIDLAKTKEGLEEAGEFVRTLAAKEGTTLLMLGAKRQAGTIVKDEVKRATDAGAEGLFYVTNRWIGGILTNFTEVAKNYRKLKDLSFKLQSTEEKAKYTKKEVGQWDKERQKLESFYGGIAEMKKVPDALFIIDTHTEDLAVREALAMHVPAVGITDTNSDPTLITHAIPANDDAVGSIQLITTYIVDAWIEGKKHIAKEAEAKAAEDKKIAEKAEKAAAKVKEDQEKAEKAAAEKKEEDKEKKLADLRAENAATKVAKESKETKEKKTTKTK